MLAWDAKPLICKMLEEKLCHTLSLRRRLYYGEGMTVLLLLPFSGTCPIGKKNAWRLWSFSMMKFVITFV
jgi:hypothetical protein